MQGSIGQLRPTRQVQLQSSFQGLTDSFQRLHVCTVAKQHSVQVVGAVIQLGSDLMCGLWRSLSSTRMGSVVTPERGWKNGAHDVRVQPFGSASCLARKPTTAGQCPSHTTVLRSSRTSTCSPSACSGLSSSAGCSSVSQPRYALLYTDALSLGVIPGVREPAAVARRSKVEHL